MPVLQLLGHAPVHPQAPHALPHGRAALPLRDLREEVHPARAHEAAHTGEWGCGRPGSGVTLGSARLAGSGWVVVWLTAGSSEVGSIQPLTSPTWLCPPPLSVLSASGTPALSPWVPPRVHFSAPGSCASPAFSHILSCAITCLCGSRAPSCQVSDVEWWVCLAQI